MKKVFKEIGKFVALFVVLITIYFLLLTTVSMFPSKIIKENIKESADYLVDKPESEKIDLGFKNVFIFQFTNALMLNTAYSIDSDHPIESFLVARKNYIPGVTTIIYENTPKDLQSGAKYYNEKSKKTDAYQIAELFDTAYENDIYESFEYARYWHGYLVYLRPLLTIFNYEQIELMSTLTTLILLITTAFFIGKKINPLIGLSLILSFFAVDIHIVSVSINEITCFTLSLIFTLYILLRFENIKRLGMTFFVIGSITNFIDFLTNPVVVYALPIITYFLLLQQKQKVSWKETIKIYFKTSVLWALGYGLTWAAKWVLTDIILNKGIIQNAIEQIQYRTTGEKKYTILQLYKNLMIFISGEATATIFITGIMFMIIQVIANKIARKNEMEICKEEKTENISELKNNKTKNNNKLKKENDKKANSLKIKEQFEKVFPYLIGFCIPIVWYGVLFNHSIVHRFFTYRNFLVIFFAFQVTLIMLVSKINVKHIETQDFKEN